jgi:hypothetical protein
VAQVQYSGWALTNRCRVLAALTRLGVPPAFPDRIDCEHITRAYPDTTAPAPARARIVGVATGARVQALVAEVCGTTARPDGRVYHITYSLAEGAAPVESNDLLADPRADVHRIGPIPITTTPFLRTVKD